jgi:hypothetical protein
MELPFRRSIGVRVNSAASEHFAVKVSQFERQNRRAVDLSVCHGSMQSSR